VWGKTVFKYMVQQYSQCSEILESGQISIVDYRYVVEAQIPTKKATIIETILLHKGTGCLN